MPRALDIIHRLKEKVKQFFPIFFFKSKKQGEKIEVLQEERRREVIFVSWKFVYMYVSLQNSHKNTGSHAQIMRCYNPIFYILLP